MNSPPQIAKGSKKQTAGEESNLNFNRVDVGINLLVAVSCLKERFDCKYIKYMKPFDLFGRLCQTCASTTHQKGRMSDVSVTRPYFVPFSG